MKRSSSKRSLRPFEGKILLSDAIFLIVKGTQAFFTMVMDRLYLFLAAVYGRCRQPSRSPQLPFSAGRFFLGGSVLRRKPAACLAPLGLGGSPCWPQSTWSDLRRQQVGPLWDLALVLHVSTIDTELPVPLGFDIWSLRQICFERLSLDVNGALPCGQGDGPPWGTEVAGTDPPGGRRQASKGPLHPPASTPPSSLPAAPDCPFHSNPRPHAGKRRPLLENLPFSTSS